MNRHSRRHFIKTTSLASASVCAAGTGSGTSAWADSGTHPGTIYRSTWDRMSNGYWTGPDTWANPWEDWRIDEGWLVCTKNGSGNRTVHCLTHQLNDTASEAEIAVTIAARQRATGEGATSVVEAATGTDLRAKGSA
ncbi:MAG: hypothetical protein GX621_00615 [Pirellulaceae bacterium]|nr:hypothetical protein [Pirellulaceae bacterium]